MLDLEPDHLAGAQAAAIAETEQGADLEVAGDGQQAPPLPTIASLLTGPADKPMTTASADYRGAI